MTSQPGFIERVEARYIALLSVIPAAPTVQILRRALTEVLAESEPFGWHVNHCGSCQIFYSLDDLDLTDCIVTPFFTHPAPPQLAEAQGRIERKEEGRRATQAAKALATAFDGIGAGRKVKNYTPGEWFNAGTIDEMQSFFMSRLPAIREIAREAGYAIGLHGSCRRDFDLMAMQWREDAADKDMLAHAIAIAACGITRDGEYQWEQKPSGRFAVSIPICWTDHTNPDFDKPSIGHIDLSVIATDQPAKDSDQ